MATGVTVALAAYRWVLLPRLPTAPGGGGYLWNGLAGVLLLAAARLAGLSRTELGLTIPSRRAATAAGAAAAAVGAVYAGLLAFPPSRPLLVDPQVSALGLGQLLLRAGVLIPLGTALWEELAFRGVLLAALRRPIGPPWALTVSSALFGLWHLSGGAPASTAEQSPPRLFASAGVVVATSAAGAALGWLRLRSGSILAPALVHAAVNSLGLEAAALAGRTTIHP